MLLIFVVQRSSLTSLMVEPRRQDSVLLKDFNRGSVYQNQNKHFKSRVVYLFLEFCHLFHLKLTLTCFNQIFFKAASDISMLQVLIIQKDKLHLKNFHKLFVLNYENLKQSKASLEEFQVESWVILDELNCNVGVCIVMKKKCKWLYLWHDGGRPLE